MDPPWPDYEQLSPEQVAQRLKQEILSAVREHRERALAVAEFERQTSRHDASVVRAAYRYANLDYFVATAFDVVPPRLPPRMPAPVEPGESPLGWVEGE